MIFGPKGDLMGEMRTRRRQPWDLMGKSSSCPEALQREGEAREEEAREVGAAKPLLLMDAVKSVRNRVKKSGCGGMSGSTALVPAQQLAPCRRHSSGRILIRKRLKLERAENRGAQRGLL